MEESVKKFKSIFYGLDRAYGIYKSSGESTNGKAGGQAFIKKAPVTDQLWIDHINGKEPSLGIIPIRDDATCTWGCIDIDTYPLKHDKIIRKIRISKETLIFKKLTMNLYKAKLIMWLLEKIGAKNPIILNNAAKHINLSKILCCLKISTLSRYFLNPRLLVIYERGTTINTRSNKV